MSMIQRFKTVLINPTRDEELDREPLLAFSFYLRSRVLQLLSIAVEITEDLDKGFGTNPVDGARVGRASIMMWLWALGTYEVVRTMCQGKAQVKLPNGRMRRVELHWYEAHGIGRKDIKIKYYLD